MRGTYCLVASLPQDTMISVGALGRHEFPRGIYVYVGSAAGGIEQRVRRHRSRSKSLRWHIDHFLKKAEVTSVIALPSDDSDLECIVAHALLECEDARVVVDRFGSSDCRCRAHLIYLGDVELECALESVYWRLTLLPGIYPRNP